MNGKIVFFSGGKPNGTSLSTGNFSKNREDLRRYSSFHVFTGTTGKSLYHLLYHINAMLLGEITRLRSRKSLLPSCFSVQHPFFQCTIKRLKTCFRAYITCLSNGFTTGSNFASTTQPVHTRQQCSYMGAWASQATVPFI